MTKATDIPEVVTFLGRMDADMRQFRAEEEAEKRLAEAKENYEKVCRQKILIIPDPNESFR